MKLRSETGSALVLTLLFIMLLTTMSTAMYLYATKQSLFADSEYTTVAASYVADAGLEHGKALLARRDMMLNTYGQNPSDNKVGRDDFPVMLPMSKDIGQYETNSLGERITNGKQGVGNYSLRIDAAFAEIVDFDFDLVRTPGFDPSDPTQFVLGVPARLNRLLPGKTLQVQIRQGIEVVNAYSLSYLDDASIFAQNPGTLRYQLGLTNIINPFLGEPVTLEINRTPIEPNCLINDINVRDAWGNSLVIYPNLHGTGVYANHNTLHIPSDAIGNMAIFFTPEPDKSFASYILMIENCSVLDQPDMTVTLYYSVSGFDQPPIVIGNWVNGDKNYAFLDFSNDAGMCRLWRRDLDHPLESITDAQTTSNSIIMEVSFPSGFTAGANISVTRGVPGDIDLGMRMRCEGMPSGCWFPQYPDCGGGSAYQPMMTLPVDQNHILYDMTPEMMNLGHKARLKVNELYTISSTGNVESASETRSVMASPASFLDYARFAGSRINLTRGAMFGGKIYCQERIELPGASSVYFYDDVLTSNLVVNPSSAQFPQGGEIYENVALIEFPSSSSIQAYYISNAARAWEIGTPFSTAQYDLFLGNYGYVNTQVTGEFYGFDFSDPAPIYRAPTGNILNTDNYNYRDGWVPGVLAPPTSILSTNFNGLIIVNGDVHVWGKLHGRSLTILARGDIYLEREILTGTDELDPSSPEGAMSSNEGMPVHLALVPFYEDYDTYKGDVILSQNCPRIMTVQASLMAFNGSLIMEDTDYSSPSGLPSGIDSDHSHKFARITWNPGGYYNWGYTAMTSAFSWDLNRDGRLTDGNLSAIGELPRIELGDWNENQIKTTDELWYLMVIGAFIDKTSGGPAHFSARGFYQATGAGERNGNTTNYRYDPSIRINAPPLLPIPDNTLKILEWDNAVYN
ncbi:hypothetical protein JW823_01435 [bacterium]|nr:hypothetical protein [candidate division CSSED10-310 bacterium]